MVFMDEVDSLCGERGGDGGLVSELLTLMAQKAVQKKVMVIGATNRPHAVDEVRATIASVTDCLVLLIVAYNKI